MCIMHPWALFPRHSGRSCLHNYGQQAASWNCTDWMGRAFLSQLRNSSAPQTKPFVSPFFAICVLTDSLHLCVCCSSPVYDKQGFLLQLDTKLWVLLPLINTCVTKSRARLYFLIGYLLEQLASRSDLDLATAEHLFTQTQLDPWGNMECENINSCSINLSWCMCMDILFNFF